MINESSQTNTIHNRALKITNYFLLFIIVLIVLLPILIVFIVSFKTNEEYMYSGLFELPKNLLNFDNYYTVIIKGKLLLGMKNTVFLMAVSVAGSVIMGTMVSYVLGRLDFKCKKAVFFAFLLPTIIPGVTTQVATFSVIKGLHLYNTSFAGILLYIGTDIMQIYILLQFIGKIPSSLDESAAIDGASYFRIYRSIILPQLKPAIATVIILKAIHIYNDMLIPYLYMPKSSLKTVTTALLSFSSDRNSQWNVMGAGIVAVMVPTLILYLFLQKYIISGVTDGAVKS